MKVNERLKSHESYLWARIQTLCGTYGSSSRSHPRSLGKQITTKRSRSLPKETAIGG